MASKKHYFEKLAKPEYDPKQKITTLIQFARKAGKLSHGFEACKRDVKNHLSKLIIVTEDISANTLSKLSHMSDIASGRIPLRRFSNSEELSMALGLSHTVVFSVLDNNFASKILTYIDLIPRLEEN